MGRRRISEAPTGARHRGRSDEKATGGHTGRHAFKRPAGVHVVERDGYFHLHGTIRVKGRGIRVRESTGLPARSEHRDAAEELRRQKEQEIRDAVLYGIRPTVPFAVAAEGYLTRRRKRPLNAIDVARIKELTRHFGTRPLALISEEEWAGFIDARMSGRLAVTRERYIDLVMSFLAWCRKRPRLWLAELPAIERDQEARYKKQRRARRVGDLRPELIASLIDHAAPHLRGQMAIKWSTGARVSSLIYGCRLCDYLAAEGREQITFHDTKNGQRVTASVHPWAAAVMRDYLAWRGNLFDREAQLFLTHFRRPYRDNGKAAGGQTKTAFKGMVKRTIVSLRRTALTYAAELRRLGEGQAARQHWGAARSDIALLTQLTPHWFRHLLATTMVGLGDLQAAMDQGGWLDVRSVMGYSHDVPDRRRAVVAAMPAPSLVDTLLTRNVARSAKTSRRDLDL
jgi:hypothetical protein